ncbi:MAG: triose-phosphate isomerase [Planctomycetota bacterium]
MRRKYVAGNWKMNMTLTEARALIEGIISRMPKGAEIDVGFFPPFVLLFPLADILQGKPVRLGAQNCYFEPKGAFTGEISPGLIKDSGATVVIIGHSERRHIFGETNDLLAKKVMAALKAGLEVIYCVGETLEERQADKTEAVLLRQLHEVLGSDVSLDKVTIAYEPVWAIGTGQTATPAQAQEAQRFIRQEIKKLYNAQTAETLRIQYGGSVKAGNARELMAQPDVDGALVGGASLKVDEFVGIIEGAISAQSA